MNQNSQCIILIKLKLLIFNRRQRTCKITLTYYICANTKYSHLLYIIIFVLWIDILHYMNFTDYLVLYYHLKEKYEVDEFWQTIIVISIFFLTRIMSHQITHSLLSTINDSFYFHRLYIFIYWFAHIWRWLFYKLIELRSWNRHQFRESRAYFCFRLFL